MGQRKMKKRLKRYAAACEKIVPVEKEQRIQEILQAGRQQENMAGGSFRQVADSAFGYRARGTVWSFLLEQVGYLGRYCLVWQAAWLALFYYMVRHGVAQLFGKDNGNALLVVVSILPPLLILLTVEEVTKVYQRSMLEIEYATKYSLRSAVMIRMSVLCVIHSFILMICIVCLHFSTEAELGRLFVYGFTPMTMATALLFKMMQHWQGEFLLRASVGVYVLMAGLAFVGSSGYVNCYQPAYFKIWCIVCAIGIVSVVRQMIRLNRKLESYEAVVQ